MHDAQMAARLVGLLDLTSLGEADGEADVDRLCERASTPLGHVAAVCVWPRFAARCVSRLQGTGVPVAAVANFPHGGADVDGAVGEVRAIVESGATEVDLVMPYRAWLDGETGVARDMVAASRDACGDARLKVILETGVIEDPSRIAAATTDVIAAGAHFVKTSTGKVPVNATPEAARAMLGAIRASGADVGFKAAGGIRTVEDALGYVRIAEAVMGDGWVSPAHFRIGASSLLDALLAR